MFTKIFEKKTIPQLYKIAFALAIFTIVYNIAEGVISVYLGYADDSLTLFGFGVDSFIETLSGIGIYHMIYRISKFGIDRRDEFERTALNVTGTAFYILAGGLFFGAILRVINQTKPETIFWGIVISLVSIAVMVLLMKIKTEVGTRLNSKPIIADAHCTKVCVYMSVILLAASALYELTHIPYIDALGTAGLAYFSFKEGKECFYKAKTDSHCGCSEDDACNSK